ncbi:hypothetical protein DL93DRAFT_2171845 [Clavulina sp. PMI_390]|nr:hypothetical protein DL93DRAFT_2171845 [Clavulina sp. PMI_390]
MSLPARTLARGVRVARVQQTRRYAAKAAEHPPGYVPTGEEWIAQRQAVQDHAAGTTKLWKNVSLYACIPALVGIGYYVKTVEDAHHAHMAHEKHEHGEVETPNYAWLNKRGKPFPWGMNSLFFNPEVNKDMSSE